MLCIELEKEQAIVATFSAELGAELAQVKEVAEDEKIDDGA